MIQTKIVFIENIRNLAIAKQFVKCTNMPMFAIVFDETQVIGSFLHNLSCPTNGGTFEVILELK